MRGAFFALLAKVGEDSCPCAMCQVYQVELTVVLLSAIASDERHKEDSPLAHYRRAVESATLDRGIFRV
jgi:hypothetical protein